MFAVSWAAVRWQLGSSDTVRDRDRGSDTVRDAVGEERSGRHAAAVAAALSNCGVRLLEVVQRCKSCES